MKLIDRELLGTTQTSVKREQNLKKNTARTLPAPITTGLFAQ